MQIVDKREHPGLATLFLARLGSDERVVEFVDTLEPGISKADKWVMMVSTQVGCAVGCRMCDAGALGYFGNLSAEEIMAQVRHVIAENPGLDPARHPKLKIHFARMGEPSLNPHTIAALETLAREYPGSGILPSLSTVAPKCPSAARFFEDLLELKRRSFGGGRFQLQFSVHSLDERARREVVPVKTWALEEIARYGARFVSPGDRKITLNFALSEGEGVDAARARSLFDPSRFLIKITPVNPTRTADGAGATYVWSDAPPALAESAADLRTRGFEVILSPSLPEEIDALTSCGQLWSQDLKRQADLTARNRRRERECYVTAGTLTQKASLWSEQIDAHRKNDLPLSPGESGLLVLDMQDFFLSPRSPAYRPQARAILGRVRDLVDGFREAGRPVFFIRHAHDDPRRDGGLMSSWWRQVCVEGTPWARVSSFLEPREEDTLRKCRYSAFSQPQLAGRLRAAGVSQLVVAGIMTSLCVESTVRDAFDEGFSVWTALDATAAHSEELHLASLKSLAFGFSRVQAVPQILAALRSRQECC